MNNEISSDLEINNFKELITFSDRVAKSSMIPKDYIGKPENIIVAVMMGKEVGLKPFQAMQNIAVINGRPAIWGDAILAIIMSHPDFEDITEEDDGNTASCTIKRRGRNPHTVTFSMADAKQAGLSGKQGPWSQYPARMRKYRARAFCARDTFADALKGIQIAEEVQDLPQEKDITPPKERIDKLVDENLKPTIHVYDATQEEKTENKIPENEQESEMPEEVTKVIELIKASLDQKELMQHMKGLANFNPEHRAIITLAFNLRSQEIKEEAKKAKENEQFLKELGEVE